MDIQIVDLPAWTGLIASARCMHGELGEVIGGLFGKIVEANPDAELVAPPCVFYRLWEPYACEIDAVLPVEEGTIPQGGITLRHYPATKAATATYVGHYRGLPEFWKEFFDELERRGIGVAGAPWDSYLTDPAEEPDPSNWITEIYMPLR